MPATTLLHSEATSISSSLFLFSSFATSTSSLFEPKAFGEKYFERFAFCSAELHFAALCCKLARSLAQQLSRSLTAHVVRHTLMCFVLSPALAVVAFSQIFRLSFSSQGRNYSQKKECKKYISLSFPALCVYIAASKKTRVETKTMHADEKRAHTTSNITQQQRQSDAWRHSR